MPTGILDKTMEKQTEKVGTIKTSFELQNKAIVYDSKEKWWFLSLVIAYELPRTYRGYSISLVFNEDPYLARIEHCKKRIEHVQSQRDLLTETKEGKAHTAAEVKKIKQEMEYEQGQMKEMSARCIPIEFGATMEELKYTSGESKVKLRVPDTVIAPLNDVKAFLSYYKMVLVPLT